MIKFVRKNQEVALGYLEEYFKTCEFKLNKYKSLRTELKLLVIKIIWTKLYEFDIQGLVDKIAFDYYTFIENDSFSILEITEKLNNKYSDVSSLVSEMKASVITSENGKTYFLLDNLRFSGISDDDIDFIFEDVKNYPNYEVPIMPIFKINDKIYSIEDGISQENLLEHKGRIIIYSAIVDNGKITYRGLLL